MIKAIAKFFLKWSHLFNNLSSKERKQWVKIQMEGVKEFATSDDPKMGEKIFKDIVESGRYDLVGVMPNVFYMKIEGSEKELESPFCHPFSGPTMLFHIKGTPCFMFLNPGLRFNDSVLSEMKQEKSPEEMLGISH